MQVGAKLHVTLNIRYRMYAVSSEYFKLFYKRNNTIHSITKGKGYKS